MKEEKIKTKIEVFVCNNEDCKEKGAKDLASKLKKWAKEEHKGEIKVYRSGCLGHCEEGIAVAIFPEKNMLTEVKANDFEQIRDLLEEKLN